MSRALPLMMCFFAAAAARAQQPARVSRCAKLPDQYFDAVRMDVAHFFSSDADSATRLRYHIDKAASINMMVVQSDTLCDAAALLVNRLRRVPDSTIRRIYLFRAGNVFVGTDPQLLSGEWHDCYIFDAALSKVLLDLSR